MWNSRQEPPRQMPLSFQLVAALVGLVGMVSAAWEDGVWEAGMVGLEDCPSSFKILETENQTVKATLKYKARKTIKKWKATITFEEQILSLKVSSAFSAKTKDKRFFIITAKSKKQKVIKKGRSLSIQITFSHNITNGELPNLASIKFNQEKICPEPPPWAGKPCNSKDLVKNTFDWDGGMQAQFQISIKPPLLSWALFVTFDKPLNSFKTWLADVYSGDNQTFMLTSQLWAAAEEEKVLIIDFLTTFEDPPPKIIVFNFDSKEICNEIREPPPTTIALPFGSNVTGAPPPPCLDHIVDVSSWSGNMGATLTIPLAEDIKAYDIQLETHVPLTNLVFWEAASSPSQGTIFSATSHSWFSGAKAGQTLRLGFQLAYSGSTLPKLISIILNNRVVCGGLGDGGSLTTAAPTTTEVPTTKGPTPTGQTGAPSSGCLKEDLYVDHGEVTLYGTDPHAGNCGFTELPSDMAKWYFVAISHENWNDGAYCGACVRMKYTDGKELVGYIHDQCPGCPSGHWDLSDYAYYNLTSETLPGIMHIKESQIIECPNELVSGNLKVKVKDGSNPWWAAYQVTNHKYPINGMSMSVDGGSTWVTMEGPGGAAPSGFWFLKPNVGILNADNGLENYKIRVESDTGNIIVDMVGVVSGSETDSGTNNGGGEDCGGTGSNTSITQQPPATTESSGECSASGTICGRPTSEPLTEDIKTLRDTTSCALENNLVEAITAGNPSNPDNVKNVENILPETTFNDYFPNRDALYTYENFLKAVGKYPAICKSASTCPRILANMFAHFQQETAGLFYLEEINKPAYCADWSAWIVESYPCIPGKKYFGRGAKQLSWNYNYGAFSAAMFGDPMKLLNEPELVATTWLNFAGTMWFYVTPQPPKPSMLQVVDGTWSPNAFDINLKPGLGASIMILNGALECGWSPSNTNGADNRGEYYKDFAGKLGVDITNEKLDCKDSQAFTEQGSAGGITLYWDKTQNCKLVSWQTAYSALVEGDYSKCMGIETSSGTCGSETTASAGITSGTGAPSKGCLKEDLYVDHGEVTLYGTDPHAGNCGFTELPSDMAKWYFVAISHENWNDGAYCGACVRMKYTDGKELIGYIHDKCPGCPSGHWDLSDYAYYNLTSETLPGIMHIAESQIIECPNELVSGNLKVKVKDGSNPWWAAYQVTNHKYPINGMSMSVDGGSTWVTMEGPGGAAPSGFWFLKPNVGILNADNGLENYKIRVESDTGNIIVDMVGVVSGSETDSGTNNGGGEDCGGTGSGTGQTPAPTGGASTTGGSDGLTGDYNCQDVIINKSEWTGNMGATLSIKLAEAVSTYSISLKLDNPVNSFVFWEADITPSTGTEFTVTSKTWFAGKAAGENLDLGFQIGFDGTNTPKFTSILFNGKNVCDGGMTNSGGTTSSGQSESSTSKSTTAANGTPAGDLCSDPNGLYPDPTDCGKYYQCAHGDPVSYSCAEGTLYSTACKCCDWAANVQCNEQGGSESGTAKSTTAASGTPAGDLCSDPNGLYPDPTDCGKYYQCAHGDPVSYSCAEGTLYSAAIKSCDWAANVQCNEQGSSSTGSTGSTAAATTTTKGTTTPNPCVDPHGFYPADPTNCAKYFQCAHGVPYPYTCAEGTLFSVTIKSCDWKNNLQCTSECVCTTKPQFKYKNNWFIKGASIKTKKKITSVQKCWKECEKVSACKFVSFYKKKKECTLLKNNQKGSKKTGYQSGPVN